MAIRRFATAKPGVKSNRFWDQDTQQGSIVPIESVTISNATSTSIGFANIPQIYQDLMLVITSRRTDAVTEGTQFLYTNISGSVVSTTKFYGDGATATSSRVTAQNAGFIGAYPGANAGVGIYGTQVVHFFNYANTNKFKTYFCKSAADRNGAGQTELSVSLIRDNGALTTVGVSTYNASVYYVPGSTATLYGIKAGS